MKDAELCQKFSETIRAENLEAVRMSKVNGHATNDMVAENKVPFEEKRGNDQADIAAEKGTKETQCIRLFASFYEKRHLQYTKLIGKVQFLLCRSERRSRE